MSPQNLFRLPSRCTNDFVCLTLLQLKRRFFFSGKGRLQLQFLSPQNLFRLPSRCKIDFVCLTPLQLKRRSFLWRVYVCSCKRTLCCKKILQLSLSNWTATASDIFLTSTFCRLLEWRVSMKHTSHETERKRQAVCS